MKTKYCPRCEEDKALAEFSHKNKAKKILADHCKVCVRSYAKEHYEANKKQYKERAARNHQKTIEWYRKLKESLQCCWCGEKTSCTLDFHHVDASKEFEIGTGFYKVSRKTLIAELAKCVCLCANCHRKVHAGLIDLPAHIKRITIK